MTSVKGWMHLLILPIPTWWLEDKNVILEIYEDIFNHKAFTGRSGTFFGYEGLGSIYWHMVSKLRLAVYECCIKAIQDQESETTSWKAIGALL